jgi:Beta-lactamase enzyme family
MGMRALVAGSAVLLVGVVACSSAGAATASPSRAGTSRTGKATASAGPKASATPKDSAGPKASTASNGSAAASTSSAIVTEGLCTAPAAYRALAAQLSADIKQGLSGRNGVHAVSVYDRVTGVSCLYNGSQHFDSASIVKAIIMAALLRWHQETGTPLSAWEKDEATEMITQSDNDAATDLWDELGMDNLQDFLNLAGMSETELGQGGDWGLTQVTAHDEMLLLKLLTAPNSVLDAYSRSYQLGLMSQVTSWESWGVTAGTPSGVTWHVKNGWLPDATGWHINSIGTFSGSGKDYMIAVLSDNTDMNDDEQYGINTIEDVARRVQRDLNNAALTGSGTSAAAAKLAAAPNVASPVAQPSSWAVVPALPTPTRTRG